MIAGAALAAPIALNSENLTIQAGGDNILNAVWTAITTFAERVFDPHFAWLFWITIGFIVGATTYSRLRRIEDASRGRAGGSSLSYLKWEARLVRWAILIPFLRRISSDFDRDIEELNAILTTIHSFPALPAVSFGSTDSLPMAAEYLRPILPNLSLGRMDEARAAAKRFTRRTRRR